jgi:hypothetical protein
MTTWTAAAPPLDMGGCKVAVTGMVTGLAPQSNVMMPPLLRAACRAANVQLAAVPEPTTLVGLEVSTSWASPGRVSVVHEPFGFPADGNAPESPDVVPDDEPDPPELPDEPLLAPELELLLPELEPLAPELEPLDPVLPELEPLAEPSVSPPPPAPPLELPQATTATTPSEARANATLRMSLIVAHPPARDNRARVKEAEPRARALPLRCPTP